MSSSEQFAALQDRIQGARKAGDPAAEARLQTQAGEIQLSRNLPQQAQEHFLRAFELYSSSGLNREAAHSANRLAACLLLRERPADALAVLDPLAEQLDPAAEPRLAAAVTGNRGLAYSKLKDYTKSTACHKQVLEVAERSSSPDLQLQAQINLADTYLQEGRYRQAQGFALVARDLAQEMEDSSALVAITELLGMISARQGDHREAIRLHSRAARLAAQLDQPHRQALAMANRALSHEALTELERARDLLTAARDLFGGHPSDHLDKINRDLDRIRTSLQAARGGNS